MKRILVLGGAGYIGSHTVYELLDKGFEVIVADNLETGHRKAVPTQARLHVGDLRDPAFLDELFATESIDAVIHFAGYSLVGESMENPLKYFENNLGGTRNLLAAMVKHGVKTLIFSSSAAVYGEPEKSPIFETAPTVPTNPYGATKLAAEQLCRWTSLAHNLRYVSLRYFNACGAHPTGQFGEDHQPETHLIPIILQAANGTRPALKIFGTDYPTPDGSCIRDYVHVSDLAQAHVKALEYLERGGESGAFNLGNGVGFSVLEMLQAAEEVTGVKIPSIPVGRRPGDPAVLVASGERAKAILGWKPHFESIHTIVETAWKWHRSHPNGFDDDK